MAVASPAHSGTGTPAYFLPTENEWYKAAYYDPLLNSGSGGYYTYATQSILAPDNSLALATSESNDANYCPINNYTDPANLLTPVGTFTHSPSYYDTFDQSGDVEEWNETAVSFGDRGLRGGEWGSDADGLAYRGLYDPSTEGYLNGFRIAGSQGVPEPGSLALLLAGAVGLLAYGWRRKATTIAGLFVAVVLLACTVTMRADTMPMVTVGDPGNVADSTGYGSVGYTYQIGTYDVTLTQYTAFLNSVAATDTYGLYNASLATVGNVAGISRSGLSGSYTYSVIGDGQRPVTYVSWYDAVRYTNWLTDGNTQSGAYAITGGSNNGGIVTVPTTAQACRLGRGRQWHVLLPARRERMVQGGLLRGRRHERRILGLSDEK